MMRRLRSCHSAPGILTVLLSLAGCGGVQSALVGDGPESQAVALLSWIMFVGAAVILGIVIALTATSIFANENYRSYLQGREFVVAGGVLFPVVVLTALLIYGLSILGDTGRLPADTDSLRISVTGEQWWWRVHYEHADGTTTESANEIRIPVNRAIELTLESADVLHSFWVPAYAGKVDMVPGRSNLLRLAAMRAGITRGQCAEYCGGAHALMSFYVVALEAAEFDAWLERERGPAIAGANAGSELFLASGCGGCHRVRGTPADGRIGPDLTHVGSRISLGAGTLPADAGAFARWLQYHQDIKPQNHMPPFDFFSHSDYTLLADYLGSLK
jgi:cytochrome c oxidase subunit 2